MLRANDENSACLLGVAGDDLMLDHELYGEAFYTLPLAVTRMSGTVDTLPVTLPGHILHTFPARGDCLRIGGQLRSYNRRTDTGTRLDITVFARELAPALPEEEPENEIVLTGYLCKPAVFRTTPFMREIADVLIAVNRAYNKSDYLPCIAWGRNARFAQGLAVGDRVRIIGRMQSREYQKTQPDGTVRCRTAYEVSCSSLELL